MPPRQHKCTHSSGDSQVLHPGPCEKTFRLFLLFLLWLAKLLSHVRPFATQWTVTGQAPLSTRFSRQEYWSGLPGSPPGDPPHTGIEPGSLVIPALADGFFTPSATWENLAPSLEKGPFPASLTCPLEHVLNILRCPRHKTGLICVLEPQDESPLVLLGKDVVVQGSAEATQVQEA